MNTGWKAIIILTVIPLILATSVVSMEKDKVNINTATIQELQTLSRIRSKTARSIIHYRNLHGPFRSIEEIMNVPGIGAKDFYHFKDLITIGKERALPVPEEETKEPFTLYIKSYSPGIGGTPISEVPIGVPLSEIPKVNINTASQFQLEIVLGIDSIIARKIIDYRPYHKIEDMRKVPGIDKKTFDRIKDRIIVKEPLENESR
ncbi:MAG TPA: helix-hairpin-helix domain-containing protein [bacterium]|nr:helix-hairpin-helix domain-containing protein [bacterium]